MFDDDYYEYYEPSKVDEILAEYQEEMKTALLDSIKIQIECLKTENESLKKYNEELREENINVKIKENELEKKEKLLEKDFYKNKFSEMLKPYLEKVDGYYVEEKYIKKRKCKLCDENRKIEFKSLTGKIIKQSCECDTGTYKYVPKYVHLHSLSLSKRNDGYFSNNFLITPDFCKDTDEYGWNKFDFTKIIKDLDDLDFEYFYENFNEDEILFTSKSNCKKYCDWLNKNKIEEDEEIEEEFDD